MKQRGSSMFGILAAVAIIMVLAIVLFNGGFGRKDGKDPDARADGKGITVLGRARYKAIDTECQSNIEQVRLAFSMFKTSSAEDQNPKSLSDINIAPNMLKCPIAPHEPYNYDPVTGKIYCPHPGHEKY